ncbi:MAG TPA: DUF5700 domain-containing putative Zn-dependent protease [Longimicrobiales bacterium]
MHIVTRVVITAACLAAAPAAGQDPRLNVRVVTDEADAVLHILELRAAGRAPQDEDWQRLFATEGYRRLQQREHSLQRPFEDSTFRSFVMSDSLLAHATALRTTLEQWRTIDANAAARRAFAYLPQHAVIRARVYPVIKPRDNSFVFEPRTNPAIFLYLDPSLGSAKFENTLAHELHHIGMANACSAVRKDPATPAGVQDALDWMGAFAEGLAMLAAAGSADVHPHAASDARERAIWERDIANVTEDMRRMEQFYLQLIDGALTEEEATQRGFGFINTDSVPQGPFYTLGWLMASTIEQVHGRAALVASTCDPRTLLSDYQRAARQIARRSGRSLPLWSDVLLRRIGAGGF